MTLSTGTLALVCLILLGIGYALFVVLERIPATRPAIKAAWPILHMEALVVGAVAGALWLGGWVMALAVLAHCARVAWEAACVVGRRRRVAAPLAVAAGVAGVSALLALTLPLWLVALLVVAGWVAAFALRPRAPEAADLAIWPCLPLVLFTVAALQGGYSGWLLLAFLLVETFDSYALLGGKILGRTKAFPRLSPNKTVEGLATGAAALVLTAALAALALGQPVGGAIAAALLAGPLAVAGDLGASRLKRLSGVKDYPAILPYQGGLFDITDAWIAAGTGLVLLALLGGMG